MRRSPGTPGQPGDAASSGRCPHRDRGLVDDHPTAALALHRASAQRTAPRLAGVQWELCYCTSAFYKSVFMYWSLVIWEEEKDCTLLRSRGCWDVYWCLKIPK